MFQVVKAGEPSQFNGLQHTLMFTGICFDIGLQVCGGVVPPPKPLGVWP